MSRRDTHHQEVVHALERDQWIVTDDPLTLDFAGKLVGIDLAAEKLLAAEREERRIASKSSRSKEVPTFPSFTRPWDSFSTIGM